MSEKNLRKQARKVPRSHPRKAKAIPIPTAKVSRYRPHPDKPHNWTLPLSQFAGKRACRDCGQWESDLKRTAKKVQKFKKEAEE